MCCISTCPWGICFDFSIILFYQHWIIRKVWKCSLICRDSLQVMGWLIISCNVYFVLLTFCPFHWLTITAADNVWQFERWFEQILWIACLNWEPKLWLIHANGAFYFSLLLCSKLLPGSSPGGRGVYYWWWYLLILQAKVFLVWMERLRLRGFEAV